MFKFAAFLLIAWLGMGGNAHAVGSANPVCVANEWTLRYWCPAEAAGNIDGKQLSSDTVDYGTTLTVKSLESFVAACLEPNNKKFNGWEYNGQTYVADALFVMPDNNVKMTATFVDNDSAGIKYITDGGKINDTSYSMYCTTTSTSIVMPTDVTLTGYTFEGWKNDKDVLVTEIQPAECIKDATITLTAQWKANEISITFDTNGAISGDALPQGRTCSYDGTCTAAAQGTMLKKDHVFMGWAKSATANTAEYKEGDSIKNITTGEPITLYAVWSPCPVAVAGNGVKSATLNGVVGNVCKYTHVCDTGYYNENHNAQINNATMSCAACTNLPANAEWTGAATTNTCAWDCKACVAGDNAASCAVAKGANTCTYTGTCKENTFKPTASGVTVSCTACPANSTAVAGNNAASCTCIPNYSVGGTTSGATTTGSTQCMPIKYDIKYELDSGKNYANAPSNYTYGTGATINGIPTKVGYVFGGWCDDGDKNCAYERVIGATATETQTLYAKWTLAVCNATNATATPSVANNTVTCAVVCNSGYSQGGAGDTTTKFDVVGDKNTASVDVACKVATHTITVQKNGGSGTLTVGNKTATGTSDVVLTCEHGTTVTMPVWDGTTNALTKSNSVFAGWNNSSVVCDADKTVTATWSICGTCSKGDGVESCEVGVKDNVCVASATCAMGYKDATCNSLDCTCDANKYTVVFNKNAETATGTMANQEFTYDIAQDLALNTFKYEGLNFQGWATSTNGTVVYTDGQNVKNLATSGVYNLYAVWGDADTYTITYMNVDGATHNNAKQYTINDTITFTDASKVGYKFDGWYTDSTFKTKVSGIVAGTTGNQTFYAKWTANTYECAAGTYLVAGATACTECPAGSFCVGDKYDFNADTDQGIEDCPSDYPNSDAGAKDSGECYVVRINTGTEIAPALPDGCFSQVVVTCDKPTCKYKDYAGQTGETCDPGTCQQAHESCTSVSANYYLDNGVAKTCSSYDINYPMSSGGMATSDQCYGTFTKTGNKIEDAIPTNCANVTEWNDCNPGTCEYTMYADQTIRVDCTPADCTLTPKSVTAKPGAIVDGAKCTLCGNLLYSPGGTSTKCTACDGCTACDNTNGKCSSCLAGYGLNNNACNKCTDNTYSIGETNACKACSIGYTANGNHTACDANKYTVTYSCGEGTGTAPSVAEATYDANYTPADNTCTRDGYVFRGWTVSGTKDVKTAGSAFKWTYTENKTFTAEWVAGDMNLVTFDTNGGSAVNNIECNVKSSDITLPTTTRTGYTFKGWYNVATDVETTVIKSGTCTTAMSFRAEWTPNEYVITYDCDSGTLVSGADNTQDVVYNGTFTTLPASICVRDGYVFARWNGEYTKADTTYTYETADNIKLTAQWTANTYECAVGTYLAAGATACTECPAGSFCVGNKYQFNADTDQGIEDCPSNYPNSDAGAKARTECYSNTKQRAWTGSQTSCTKPNNCASVTCNTCSESTCDYVAYSNANGTADGTIKSGCATNNKACQQTVKSVTAKADHYVSGTTCVSCPATHPESDGGAISDTGCYTTCADYDIVGGTAVAVSDKAYYNSTCKYRGVSNTGNPCKIETSGGIQTCVEVSCVPEYEFIDGACQPCNRDNATAYLPDGNCQVAQCQTGYHPQADKCVEDIQECTLPNATEATRVWDSKSGKFGDCIATSCTDNHHIESGACVTSVETCDIKHGVGTREWDERRGAWGDCVATSCDAGYTNDTYDSAEPGEQCGRCRNATSVLGEPAASSYVEGCEIASCMYQGELYKLENNECVPICPLKPYTDETGTMYWDSATKKCVHECFDGYMSW